MRLFGLIGQSLSHSFSERYFKQKFRKEGLTDCDYRNFEIPTIEDFLELIKLFPELRGVNVTIPYKRQIMKFLDFIDEKAKQAGAVNVVLIKRYAHKNILKGYNTDTYGFESTVLNVLKDTSVKALILGTGGAAHSVSYVFRKLGIEYEYVSRISQIEVKFLYQDLTERIINEYKLIVNTTPLGMYPHTSAAPDMPYEYLTNEHILIDLIYNPPLTKFLEYGKKAGSTVINGQEMLIKQAEKTWEIFCTR